METHPLRLIRSLNRSRQIATVLLNYGFGDIMERLGLRRYLQWGTRIFLRRKSATPEPHLTTARRIRMAFQDLGPTYIKFAQVLSTRPDVVPAEVIEELSLLQESVPDFPSDEAVRMVEHELGRPVSELFKEFDLTPMAAGSLAQVHRAIHHDGRQLAVKIRRPNVVSLVERDLSLMFDLAALIDRHIPEARTFDPVGLVNQFARTIRRELNFRREAQSQREFRKLFSADATLYVPYVFDDLSSEGVLTMEFIQGCRSDDKASLDKLVLPRSQLAVNVSHIFMKMSFELGVFHGDPHPGNFRVRDDGSICLLDYGMVGYLDAAKRDQLADLLVGVARHDVARVVDVMLTLTQTVEPLDLVLLTADVNDFVKTYYDLPLDELNVGQLLSDFVAILGRHTLRCPPDLMLLIRALVTLEGVGRELYPEFVLANELQPFLEAQIRRRYDPRRMVDKAWTDIRDLASSLHAMPGQLSRALNRVANDRLRIQLDLKGLDRVITEFDRSSNRVVIGVVTSSILLSTAIVIRGGGSLWINIPAFFLSGCLGIWLIYGILRSGRL
ncbi:putative protein kinase UbiB [Caulifigura coniformis]|uniref:Protein kinase domain-containing protein n=1 Tax=Caulifigura coniformis TaxID=2527983 RepID=A0A517S950_9PLAN|nr:AarF/ABC1/UbiB kinase family protein [Caulifigura coniformis]QDT52650.1 putative protein kinase UbiB [Caulifigura coniformis]